MSSAYYRKKIRDMPRAAAKKLFVNGQEMKDNYIPQTVLTDETDIELIMS